MALLGSPAFAQTPPPPSASQVTPRSVAPERGGEPRERTQTLSILSEAIPDGADALFLEVASVDLQGGFPDRVRIDARRLDAFRGTRVSVGDIYRLAAGLQADYVEDGYPFVRVIVPPQDLRDGSAVTLQVIDGFIETLVVDAVDPALRKAAQRLLQPLVRKRAVKLSQIDRQISLLADVPGASVRTAIAPGDEIGGVKLIVEAQFDRASGSVAFDNRSSAAFNNRQITFSGSVNGILGVGDSLYVYVSGDPQVIPPIGPESPRRVFGGGVSIPFGSSGLTGGAEFTKSRTEPIGGPFVTRDIFQKTTGSLTYPLVRSRLETLTLRGSVERFTERQTAPEFGALLFADRYVIGRVRLDYIRYAEVATFGGGVGLSYGGTKFDDDRSKLTATSRFTKIEISAFATTRLPGSGLVFGASAQGQRVLDGGIPLAEVFPLDGQNALSTFSAGGASADEGLVARATMSRPTPFAGGAWVATPSLFSAVGFARTGASDPFLLTRASAYGANLQVAAARPIAGLLPAIVAEYGWRDANRAYARGHRFTIDLRVSF
jgi:hemolysin activation/secretion protein